MKTLSCIFLIHWSFISIGQPIELSEIEFEQITNFRVNAIDSKDAKVISLSWNFRSKEISEFDSLAISAIFQEFARDSIDSIVVLYREIEMLESSKRMYRERTYSIINFLNRLNLSIRVKFIVQYNILPENNHTNSSTLIIIKV